METTWKIFSLNSNSADGGVTIAHWGVTATETVEEETYTAYRYGACGFSPDASDPSFVPYEDLTESAVLQWCWDNGVDQASIEASLSDKIESQKNPVSLSGVPW